MSHFSQFITGYCTPLLADAAFRCGRPLRVAPPGLAPLAPDMKLAGPVATVLANNDLVSIIAALHRAAAGEVLLIANPPTEVALINAVDPASRERGGRERRLARVDPRGGGGEGRGAHG